MRPYLRAANVTWEGLDLADVKEMNFDPAEERAFALRPGDLLLNEASGSSGEVGKPAIWRDEIPGCCFQNTVLRARPHGIGLMYLYWFCYWSALSGRFGEAGRGVNIRHLGKQGLATFKIPVPPAAEQERIVAAIEEHLSRLSAGKAMLTQAARRAGVLLALGLDRAFDDPEVEWTTLREVCRIDARLVDPAQYLHLPHIAPTTSSREPADSSSTERSARTASSVASTSSSAGMFSTAKSGRTWPRLRSHQALASAAPTCTRSSRR